MRTSTWRVASLLFASGGCALVYQIGWLREFRLIFGASTAASAAVLAIFIGGLGLGGWLLGSRADSHPRPILFYAQLETIVAIASAASPFLLTFARSLYILIGGTPRLGLVGGTIVRLILSALVLAIPTVAMGGTLPAAARGVTADQDSRRQGVAALYAMNALGAVVGCFIATFFLLEVFGTRATLWLAAAVNLLIAMLARQIGRAAVPASSSIPAQPARPAPSSIPAPAAPVAFVLTASAVVGFAFFLMELVWYRMLAPLVGGSVFTLGLILAVALAGIGIGGLLYALISSDRPATLSGFACSCLLESAAMATAFALGDRLAILALALQPLGHASFNAQVTGWTLITALVVLPAAIVAGYQFPLLIALFGRGREQLGKQIGLAYATNTIGAIVGSLAGGFGLLPWLSAPGTWRFCAFALLALGAVATVLAVLRRSGRWLVFQAATAMATLALLVVATGPTAVWRHAGIGAGRSGLAVIPPANALIDWSHAQQRAVVWDGDGIESSVALSSDATGYAFVVNGKSDGSARRDAGTQVMIGMLGAILNSKVKRSLVVGLGTGSAAGWLAAIPAMEKVDVVELEPLILDVAIACRDVNHDVMTNPKVHITLGDARETLLTSRDAYDLIASEPSNPFRAGIASLFTQEYYQAASARLSANGLFIQWMQSYEIDAPTLRTVYATLSSVFPHVETWQTSLGDLMLVAGKHPPSYSAEGLAARVREEPFRTALRDAWRATDVEGFLGHHVANNQLTTAIASSKSVSLNTDDRNVIEFGLARAVGVGELSVAVAVREFAARIHANRPDIADAAMVNWPAVDTAWLSFESSEGGTQATPMAPAPSEAARRAALVSYYQRNDRATAYAALQQMTAPSAAPDDVAMLADVTASLGSDDALPLIGRLREFDDGTADTVMASLKFHQSRFDEAADALEHAFERFRTNPWAVLRFKQQAVDLADTLAVRQPQLAGRMAAALQKPFSIGAMNEQRLLTLASLSQAGDFKGTCRAAVAPLEAHLPWTEPFLVLRRNCYAVTSDLQFERATRDLLDYLSGQPAPLGP
jgi:predicted membrane-bound spermidine synthase